MMLMKYKILMNMMLNDFTYFHFIFKMKQSIDIQKMSLQ